MIILIFTTRTKLNLMDVLKMLEICLSECFFLYGNEIWKFDNSGPIDLSIMVVLSECFLEWLEERSVAIDKLMIAKLDFKTKLNH